MKEVAILGSTGSIGKNTLDVISKNPEMFKVKALAANSSVEKLIEQIYKFNPKYVCVFDEKKRDELKKIVGKKVKITPGGIEGLCEMIELSKADIVVSAITGAIGLLPLLCAIENSKRICLANKEPMVIAGDLIMKKADYKKTEIIPIDSEPSAIFQSLGGYSPDHIKKIILTASGGPFYRFKGDISSILPEQAIKHPKWKMGPKISVDSATLMNKGLEAIEIKNLFGVDISMIEIIIHPQSVLHSAVEFIDGSIIAQFSNPDMRIPIQFSLTYPQRVVSSVKRLSFLDINRLEFFKPETKEFPALKIALYCGRKAGLYPAVLNAANEKAVELFLKGEIRFTDIANIVENVVEIYDRSKKPLRIDISEIIEGDLWAREKAIETARMLKSFVKGKR
ncbi:MAG: 1-deoxy-D-xylulose-5-phosphate reductoisomerase [Elusimicrobiota bacterium]